MSGIDLQNDLNLYFITSKTLSFIALALLQPFGTGSSVLYVLIYKQRNVQKVHHMVFIYSFKYSLLTGGFGSKLELKNHFKWATSASWHVTKETVYH